MGAFWGDPGFSAGSFRQPARAGIFDRIMQGIGVATQIGDVYQKWQNNKGVAENRKLESLAKQIGLAQTLNPEGDTQPTEKMITTAKELGQPWPTMTEARRGKAAEGMLAQIPATAGEAGPVEGSTMTRLASPELAQRQGMAAQGMAGLPAVGSPMPIPAHLPKTLEEMIIRQANKGGGMAGGKSMQELINLNTSLKHPVNPETARHNSAMEGFAGKRVELMETPSQKQARAIALAKEKENIATGSPRNQNLRRDPSGLLIPEGPGKIKEDKTTVIGDPNAAPGTTYTGNVRFTPKQDQGSISVTDEAASGKKTTVRTPIKKTAAVPASRPAPGGQATFTGKYDGSKRPIYKLPDGREQAWTGD